MNKLLNTILILQFLSNDLLAKEYSASDLEILARQNAYEEYLSHYLDVRPSKRDKIWSENTQNMGTIWLKTLMKMNEFSSESFELAIKRSQELPFKDDELFRFTLDDYFFQALKQCPENDQIQCQNKLRKILATKPTNSEWAFKTILLASKNMANQELRTLVKIILNSKDFSLYCQKPEFIHHLIRLYTEDQSLQKPKTEFITQELTKGCKNKISQHFTPFVIQSKKVNSLDDYLFFKEISSFDQKAEKLYFLKLILNAGEKSETLNIAWNYIESLKENFKERENLLNDLKSFSPLWGEVLFKNIKNERNQSFFNLLDKNFPEYIDHYARSCLNYLTAKDNAGPVNSCHEFFRNPKLSTNWSFQYEELKKKIEKSK